MHKDNEESCTFCDRIWGVAGISMGLLIMLIGFDLLSGGLLAKIVGSPVKESDEDNEVAESSDAD